jgi:hypothetical protein
LAASVPLRRGRVKVSAGRGKTIVEGPWQTGNANRAAAAAVLALAN